MSFPISPGVVGREISRDVTAAPQLGFTGGAVIDASRGPLEPTLITSEDQFIERYGRPSLDRPSMYAVIRFLRQASQVTVMRVTVDATAAEGEIVGDVDPFLIIRAENPGAWGNNLKVRFEQDEDDNSLWTLFVYENDEQVESFVVSFDVDAVDGFGQTRYIEDKVNSRSNFIEVEHDPDETNQILDGDEVELSGGSDDTTPVDDADVQGGLQYFRNQEEVTVNYLMNAGWISSAVQAEMVAVMEDRKDGIAILDMPDITDPSDLVDFRKNESNINSSFASMYAGWLRISDQYTRKEIYIPPSGDIAGVYANTQQTRPWNAPAGLRRGVINGVIGVNKIWSEAERDILYPAGINPIQSFPGEGIVVWGQKTQLSQAASLDRVNVRFLFNYVRTTAVESLRPYVFQANTQFTRNSIFSLLDNFMSGVRAEDGVYDYRIVVDGSNNPDQLVENNRLQVDIYIQPTRTAEFIRVDTISVPLSEDLS